MYEFIPLEKELFDILIHTSGEKLREDDSVESVTNEEQIYTFDGEKYIPEANIPE